MSGLSSRVTTSHIWLVSTRNVANVTEELKFSFDLLLINLNVNHPMSLPHRAD